MASKGLAKEEVMQDYLSSLLTQPDPAPQKIQDESVNLLLQQANKQALQVKAQYQQHQQTLVEQKQEQPPPSNTLPLLSESDNFQALFFKVAGLTLAVPLVHLGGIHHMDKVGTIAGKPDWFMGLMLHREDKLKVVDSAKWVMPEKYDEKLAESINYQYLIVLGDSGWGLSCESLITTETLTRAEVKWRDEKSKRPWLAGMVKEKMCALIDVDQILRMLDKGMRSDV
jgi:purine-binding chemotaxis protein CheW